MKIRPRVEDVILLLGAAYHVARAIAVFDVDYDHTFLLASGVNFLRSGHLALLGVSPTDLSEIIQKPVVFWPPGYSVFLAGLILVFRDLYWSFLAADLLSVGIFFGACAVALDRLRPVMPGSGRVLVALVLAMLPPFTEAYRANLTCLSLFIFAAVLLSPRPDDRGTPLFHFLIGGMALGVTMTMRFAYAPASIAPILALLAFDWRNPANRRRSLVAFGGWGIFVILLLIWKFTLNEDGIFSRAVGGGGFFPENLIRAHPFAADALFGNALSKIFPNSTFRSATKPDSIQFALRHALSLVILLMAAAGFRNAIRTSPTPESRATVIRFSLVGAAGTAATVALLAFLSFRKEPSDIWRLWVHVSEARYYHVALPFILIGVAMYATTGSSSWRARVGRSAALLLFVLSVVARMATHGSEQWALRQGQFGGPLELSFWDRGLISSLIQSNLSSVHPNVMVEFGSGTFGANIRLGCATILGVPHLRVSTRQRLITSKEVNVIAIANIRRGAIDAQALNAFGRFCHQNVAEIRRSDLLLHCRALVRPEGETGKVDP